MADSPSRLVVVTLAEALTKGPPPPGNLAVPISTPSTSRRAASMNASDMKRLPRCRTSRGDIRASSCRTPARSLPPA